MRIEVFYPRGADCGLVVLIGGLVVLNARNIHLKASTDQIMSLLNNYSALYNKMTDLEKKEFYHMLIERIDIYPDYADGGRILKHIEFKFPVSFSNEERQKWLINEHNVETVVILNNKNPRPKSYVEIGIDAEEYYRIKDK